MPQGQVPVCHTISFSYEIPDPPKEKSWLGWVGEGLSIAADFVPVVSQLKGAYEAYKVITDPNATNVEKAIAAAGVLPGGKLLKYADKGIDAVKGLRTMSRACCFVAGTLVMTETGLKPIEEIKIGDRVLSRDEKSGMTEYKAVTAVNRRFEREIWEVRVLVFSADGSEHTQSFGTTEDHPWRTVESKWVATTDLRIGDHIQRQSGDAARVLLVSQLGHQAPTYNLEVADFESYFVGAEGIWVHNGACDTAARAFPRAKAFDKAGIETSEHFRKNLAQRGPRGVTEDKALDAYRNGRLYHDPDTGNYIRHSSRTGVSVVTDAPTGGRAHSVFEGDPSSRWVPVPWRPGQ